jgi:hypothetical protein
MELVCIEREKYFFEFGYFFKNLDGVSILTQCYRRCKASKSTSNNDDVSPNHCFSMNVAYADRESSV